MFTNTDCRGNATDFGLTEEQSQDALVTLFADLVGCTDIKDKLSELQSVVAFAKECGNNPVDEVGFNYLFVGSPGTVQCVCDGLFKISRYTCKKCEKCSVVLVQR